MPSLTATKGLYASDRSTLLNKLVAYWKLEEASGARLDSAGANSLTDNNTVTQNPGKRGNAAQFTKANSEYLSIASNSALQMGTGVRCSIAGWIYADADMTAQHFIFTKDDTVNNREYGLYVLTNNPAFYASSDGTVSGLLAVNSAVTISVSTWYFVVGWYDGINLSIQVNNGAIATAAYTGNIFGGTATALIGAVSTGTPSLYWGGRIDELGIWKRVLTAQERAYLYSTGNGRTYPFVG